MRIGAKFKLTTPSGRTLYNHVTTSVGFLSSSDRRVHFGLGSETVSRIDRSALAQRRGSNLKNVPARPDIESRRTTLRIVRTIRDFKSFLANFVCAP